MFESGLEFNPDGSLYNLDSVEYPGTAEIEFDELEGRT